MKTTTIPSASRLLALGVAGALALTASEAAAADPMTETAAVTAATQPAPAPVVQPAPAPAAQPAPASVPAASHTHVTVEPVPMAAPSDEQQRRMRRNSDLSRARNLMITGWSIGGGTYAGSLVMGAIALDVGATEWGASMMVPGVGPFIAAGFSESATGAVFTAGMGVAQVVGIAMGTIGTVRYRRLQNVSLAATPTRGGGRLALTWRF